MRERKAAIAWTEGCSEKARVRKRHSKRRLGRGSLTEVERKKQQGESKRGSREKGSRAETIKERRGAGWRCRKNLGQATRHREERRIGAGSWTGIDGERQKTYKEQGRGRMKRQDRELGELAAYAGKPTRSPVGRL